MVSLAIIGRILYKWNYQFHSRKMINSVGNSDGYRPLLGLFRTIEKFLDISELGIGSDIGSESLYESPGAERTPECWFLEFFAAIPMDLGVLGQKQSKQGQFFELPEDTFQKCSLCSETLPSEIPCNSKIGPIATTSWQWTFPLRNILGNSESELSGYNSQSMSIAGTILSR